MKGEDMSTYRCKVRRAGPRGGGDVMPTGTTPTAPPPSSLRRSGPITVSDAEGIPPFMAVWLVDGFMAEVIGDWRIDWSTPTRLGKMIERKKKVRVVDRTYRHRSWAKIFS